MTKKIPQIRFKGFDEEWEEVKLDKIGETYSGLSGKTKDDFGVGNGKFIEFSNVLANPVTDKSKLGQVIIDMNQNTVEKGDIFFNSSSETPDEVGMSSVWNYDTKNIYLNSFCFGFRPNIKLDNYYIAYQLRSESSRKQIKILAQGISRYNISRKKLLEIHISLPSLLEQEKIGALFEKIDSLIEGQERAVDSYKGLKKSLLQKMFPKEGEKIPQIRFPGFDGEWEEIKISDIFQLKRGEVLSKKEIKDKIEDDYKYPVYSSQTLNNGILGYFNRYLFEDCITRTTDGANAGTVKFREGRFYSTNVNGVLISDKGYSNQAVAEALNRVAYRYVSKVGNPKLMNNVMSDIKISLPSLPEQKKIGDLFKKLDNLIEGEEKYLEDLKVLKKSLLQKMFV